MKILLVPLSIALCLSVSLPSPAGGDQSVKAGLVRAGNTFILKARLGRGSMVRVRVKQIPPDFQESIIISKFTDDQMEFLTDSVLGTTLESWNRDELTVGDVLGYTRYDDAGYLGVGVSSDSSYSKCSSAWKGGYYELTFSDLSSPVVLEVKFIRKAPAF